MYVVLSALQLEYSSFFYTSYLVHRAREVGAVLGEGVAVKVVRLATEEVEVVA